MQVQGSVVEALMELCAANHLCTLNSHQTVRESILEVIWPRRKMGERVVVFHRRNSINEIVKLLNSIVNSVLNNQFVISAV